MYRSETAQLQILNSSLLVYVVVLLCSSAASRAVHFCQLSLNFSGLNFYCPLPYPSPQLWLFYSFSFRLSLPRFPQCARRNMRISADRPFLQIPADIYRFMENKTPASGPAEPVTFVCGSSLDRSAADTAPGSFDSRRCCLFLKWSYVSVYPLRQPAS